MNNRQVFKLEQILAQLYEDEHSIRRIVQEAGLVTAAMRIDAHALNSWHSVLREATKQGQVDQLLRVVMAEYPNYQPLLAAYAADRPTTSGQAVPSPQLRWRPALLTVCFLASLGAGGWYWNFYGPVRNTAKATPLVVAASTATRRPARTPTATPRPTHTTTATIATTPVPATATVAPATAPVPTNVITATLQTSTTLALRIFDEGLTAHTYFIKGADTALVTVGTDLVVYHEPNPGTEAAIALLQVIGKNPDSLTAQAILIDPKEPIRTAMRVDGNLGFLSTSQLIPVFDYAAGYLLREGRVRLRPDHGLAVGDQLQALAFERIGGEIIDALPMDTVMQITTLGASKIVAAVALITGTWPVTGTIVGVVERPIVTLTTTVGQPIATLPATPEPTANATSTPSPTYPCDAEILSSTGVTIIRLVRAFPSGNAPVIADIQVGTIVEVRGKSGESEIWYHIFDKNGQEFGWILSNYLQLSSTCPN